MKKQPAPTNSDTRMLELRQELWDTARELRYAYARFNFITDPGLIDAGIYDINALKSRYDFLLRKMIRDSKNTVLVRNRRANKVAVERFRAAERFMRSGDRQAFYEEMLRAFWGYMSDKLNIPVADLTKESIREELLRRGVTTEEAQRFTDIMTRCDEAQYSPSTSVEMNEVYTEGVRIISHIESIVKR